ncbi:hypothetical protein Nepgr_006839 [Nepenthes gracilis]|uniref:Uncharacterized protein n=1 Tax=Nepenthes gracilis TaxID=150966 RepID=A0AAD3S5U2_NEPGR|nr:hypothetical protein Nepgr_006839 [Nepenthes gracilis]
MPRFPLTTGRSFPNRFYSGSRFAMASQIHSYLISLRRLISQQAGNNYTDSLLICLSSFHLDLHSRKLPGHLEAAKSNRTQKSSKLDQDFISRNQFTSTKKHSRLSIKRA